MNLHRESWDALVYAIVDGKVEFNSCTRVFEQVVDLAAEKQVSKILLDGRFLTGSLSTAERVEMALQGRKHLLQRGTKPSIAFVGHPPAFNGLGVLTRIEGADFRLFPGISEALKWLSGIPA